MSSDESQSGRALTANTRVLSPLQQSSLKCSCENVLDLGKVLSLGDPAMGGLLLEAWEPRPEINPQSGQYKVVDNRRIVLPQSCLIL